LREAKGTEPAPAWEKLKKSELAAVAAREIEGRNWLPEPLRRRQRLFRVHRQDSLDGGHLSSYFLPSLNPMENKR
jgi:hypothetical protein